MIKPSQLETMNDTLSIAEKVTDTKGWAYKLRRLPGRDYIVTFKKVSKSAKEEAIECQSAPNKSHLEAMKEAVRKVIQVEAWC